MPAQPIFSVTDDVKEGKKSNSYRQLTLDNFTLNWFKLKLLPNFFIGIYKIIKFSFLFWPQACPFEVSDRTRMPWHTPKWKQVCGWLLSSQGSILDQIFLNSLIVNSWSSICFSKQASKLSYYLLHYSFCFCLTVVFTFVFTSI